MIHRICVRGLVAMMLAFGFVARAAERFDVVIYGATSGGIAAGIQAARLGKTVVILEPSQHVGGMTTGGLGATDTGRKETIGGIAREFYEQVYQHYAKPDAWKYEQPSASEAGQEKTVDLTAKKTGRPTKWTFEPHVASQIYEAMLKEAKVPVLTGQKITSVKKEGRRIREVAIEGGKVFTAAMFIDTSYEGDLMAKAGVSYTWGREANSQYGEAFNGVRPYYPPVRQFFWPVDPYRTPGDPKSGLIAGISEKGVGRVGEGDKSMQAYCFRLCLTQVPENRQPWTKPANYEESQYELMARHIEAKVKAGKPVNFTDFAGPVMMPNKKTDANNSGPFSTDWIGGNHTYPDADYTERERITRAHEDFTRGLFWFASTSPRIPQKVRDEVNSWGLVKDEFPATGGWPPQLYVREARRMVSDYVMTDRNCRGLTQAPEPIGLGSYIIDSHQCNRVMRDGRIENEGDIGRSPGGPYGVAYKSIVPKAGECENLFVPVCLSATHASYGSIRMEPVFMHLGQVSARAAVMAMEAKTTVQQVPYAALKAKLMADGLVVEWNEPLKVRYTTIDPRSLPGVVVDEREAFVVGPWWLGPPEGFIGEGYLQDRDANKGELRIDFRPVLAEAGDYEIKFYYSGGGPRAENVPVKIVANGKMLKETKISQKPRLDGKGLSLGTFTLPAGTNTVVTISNEGTDGTVTADAVQFLKR